MLRLKNINSYYGQVHALKNVSLHLAKGEIVTLIGANGAGKSTLLNTLSAITPARSGELLFEVVLLGPAAFVVHHTEFIKHHRFELVDLFQCQGIS